MTAIDNTKPIAGYWRISKDEPGKQSSSDYDKAIRRWAKDNGRKVGHVFGDPNASGKRGTTRPQQEELFERLSEFSAVVVPRLDRLSRSMTEAIELCDIILDAGLDFVALDTPGLDTTTPSGSFARDMLLRIGQLYLDQISAGWQTVHARFADAGQYHGGGATPYGYIYVRKPKEGEVREDDREPGLHIEPEAAEIVREIFDRYLHGESLHAISDDLTARGVPTRSGGTWTHSTVKAILENPVYVGVLRRWKYRSKKVTNPKTGRPKDVRVKTGEYEDHPGRWEPIISQATWNKVSALRSSHRESAKKSGAKNLNRGQYLLTGLLYCGACDTRMFHKGQLYVCPNSDCDDGGISDKRADRLVSEAFLSHLSNPKVRAALQIPPRPKTKPNFDAQLAQVDKQMARLVEMAIQTTGPAAQKAFEKKAADLETRRRDIEKKAAASAAAETEDEIRVAQLNRFLADVATSLPELWDHRTAFAPDGSFEDTNVQRRYEDLLALNVSQVPERRQIMALVIERVTTVPNTRPKELDLKLHGATRSSRLSAPIQRRWQKKPENVAS